MQIPQSVLADLQAGLSWDDAWANHSDRQFWANQQAQMTADQEYFISTLSNDGQAFARKLQADCAAAQAAVWRS